MEMQVLQAVEVIRDHAKLLLGLSDLVETGVRKPPQSETITLVPEKPPKRHLSASTRRKMSEAHKARWAKLRKEKQAA